jgi:hypothetical protein
MPSDTFSHTVRIDASLQSVAAALQVAATWKGIGPIDEVWDATHEGEDLTGFRWSARAAGKSWEGTATRSDDHKPGTMILDLDSSEIAGALTVSYATDEGGTALTVDLFARSKGVLAGMFWGVVADALRRGLPGQIEAFGSQF